MGKSRHERVKSKGGRKPLRESDIDALPEGISKADAEPRESHRALQITVGDIVLAGVISTLGKNTTLALPQGFKGKLIQEDAVPTRGPAKSKPNFLTPGALVLAKVVGSTGVRTLLCSVDPNDVNPRLSWTQMPVKNQILWARITSEEEHGYLASLGSHADTQEIKVLVKKPKVPYAGVRALIEGDLVIAAVEAIKKESKLVVCRYGAEAAERYISFSTPVDASVLSVGSLIECELEGIHNKREAGPPAAEKVEDVESAFQVPKRRKTAISAEKGNEKAQAGLQTILGANVVFCQHMSGRVTKAHIHNPCLAALKEMKHFPYLPTSDSREGLTVLDVSSDTRFLGRIIRIHRSIADGGKAVENVTVSLLPTLVNLQLPPKLVAFTAKAECGLGKLIYETARVLKSGISYGVDLLIPTENDGSPSVIAAGASSGDALKTLISSYASPVVVKCPEKFVPSVVYGPNQPVKVRVASASMLEAVAAGSMLEEDLVSPDSMTASSTIRVGAHVSDYTLVAVLKSGSLKITFQTADGTVCGRLRENQVMDSGSSSATHKWKRIFSPLIPGAKGKAKLRILLVHEDGVNLELTAKPELVNWNSEDLEKQLNPTEKLFPGDIVMGYVMYHYDSGFVVRGFGTLFKGFVNWKDSEADARTSPRYALGATVRLRVRDILMTDDPLVRLSTDLVVKPSSEVGTSATFDPNDISVASRMPLQLRRSPQADRYLERWGISMTEVFNLDEGHLRQKLENLFPVGTEVEAVISSLAPTSPDANCTLFGNIRGRLHASDVVEAPPVGSYPLKRLKVDDVVRVRIIGITDQGDDLAKGRFYRVTMLQPEAAAKLPVSAQGLTLGQIYHGAILRALVPGKGAFINLSRSCRVLIPPRHLATLQDGGMGEVLPPVKIIKIDRNAQRVYGSLNLEAEVEKEFNYEEIKVGQRIEGQIASIHEQFGIFVEIPGGVKALCKWNAVLEQDETKDDLKLRPGDAVLAQVLHVNPKAKRIAIGLKPSFFEDLIEPKSATEQDAPTDASSGDDGENSADDADSSGEAEESSGEAGESSGDESDDEGSGDSDNSDTKSRPAGPYASMVEGNAEKDDLDALFASLSTKGAKRKREEMKVKDEVELEKEVRQEEKRLAAGDWAEAPKSRADFERLVLSDGGSSNFWIQYMAYFTELGAIQSVRDTVKRALNELGVGRSAAKQDVWCAWLNFEFAFGSKSEPTLQDESAAAKHRVKILTEVLECNDVASILKHVIGLYKREATTTDIGELLCNFNFKSEIEEGLMPRVLKFVSQIEASPRKGDNTNAVEVPLALVECLTLFGLRISDLDELKSEFIRRVNQRLENKPAAKSRFLVGLAKLEFNLGTGEKARIMFLELIKTGKKIDLWNVLLDGQVAHLRRLKESGAPPKRISNEILAARALFDKATDISELKMEKMQRLFKKWMEFEKSHGNGKGAQMCAKKAEAYVASRD